MPVTGCEGGWVSDQLWLCCPQEWPPDPHGLDRTSGRAAKTCMSFCTSVKTHTCSKSQNPSRVVVNLRPLWLSATETLFVQKLCLCIFAGICSTAQWRCVVLLLSLLLWAPECVHYQGAAPLIRNEHGLANTFNKTMIFTLGLQALVSLSTVLENGWCCEYHVVFPRLWHLLKSVKCGLDVTEVNLAKDLLLKGFQWKKICFPQKQNFD